MSKPFRIRYADEHESHTERSGKHCPLCYGLSHRVEGTRCRRCKLEYAEERIEPQPVPQQSNMAYAVEMLGGEE